MSSESLRWHTLWSSGDEGSLAGAHQGLPRRCMSVTSQESGTTVFGDAVTFGTPAGHLGSEWEGERTQESCWEMVGYVQKRQAYLLDCRL